MTSFTSYKKENKSLTLDQGFDNVLHVRVFCSPRGVVTHGMVVDEYRGKTYEIFSAIATSSTREISHEILDLTYISEVG